MEYGLRYATRIPIAAPPHRLVPLNLTLCGSRPSHQSFNQRCVPSLSNSEAPLESTLNHVRSTSRRCSTARQVPRKRQNADVWNLSNNGRQSFVKDVGISISSCLCCESRRCSFSSHRPKCCSVVFPTSAHNKPLQRTPIYWNTACDTQPEFQLRLRRTAWCR